MAWKKKKSTPENKTDDTADDSADWVDKMSEAETVRDLRQALKDNDLCSYAVDQAIVRLSIVSVRHGTTLRTAPLLVAVLKRRAAIGKLRWSFESSDSPLLGIAMLRLLAAYFEDPSISHQETEEAERLFLASIEGYASAPGLAQILPGIRAVRTQTHLDGSLAVQNRSGLPKRTEMAESGLCPAAHRQWQFEYLMACGLEDAALELADRGTRDSACQLVCSLAPHQMFAWMLEPLHRRGRVDEAVELDARLQSLLSMEPRFLDSIGCRIRFAALQNQVQMVSNLLDASFELALDQTTSPWQRMKYFENVYHAFELARERDSLFAFGGNVQALTNQTLEELRTRFENRPTTPNAVLG